ncbi:MAG: hypothetical protein L0227_12085 [Chloroflexi bacterium]|nr:hypothetical protein [Chloroflexota bacterium]
MRYRQATVINRSEAVVVLRQLLRRRGIDAEELPPFRPVWEVFKEFARVPSDATGPESDGVLYQSGVFRFYGPEEVYVDVLRQFEFVDGAGDHDHYEQLHCEFRFVLTDELSPLPEYERWWFADSGDSWPAFVLEVERRPEFVALADAIPHAVTIYQEAV